MKLLRFDPNGVMGGACGVTPEQFEALCGRLAAQRDDMLQRSTATWTGGFRMPEKLLTDYESMRENSELGRVFRVANRLHDHLDAVAVIGDQDTLLGPAALMRACCDPYHNELTRSDRGSKPRMYFACADFDNDATEGLSRRLAMGGNGPHAAEQRYAIIPIDSRQRHGLSSLAVATSMEVIGDQLAASLGAGAPRWIPKLLIPITPASGPVRAHADRRGCERDFQFEDELGGPLGVYSPATLLPAALLGLDCIQFLVGAAAMNEHFLTTEFAENSVMQLVAIESAIRQIHGASPSCLEVWTPALKGFGAWWECMMKAPLGRRESPGDGGVVHQVFVDAARTDPLPVQSREIATEIGIDCYSAPKSSKHASAVVTLPDLMRSAFARNNEERCNAGQPTTHLNLPHIDMHTLGQLFQFTWLARECLLTLHREPS